MKEEGKLAYLKDSVDALKKENTSLKKENHQLKSAVSSDEEKTEYEESQIRFRTVFETSHLGNKILNSDFEILQLNHAMVALLGYNSKEDIIGTKILDYVPEAYHHQWKTLQENLWHKNMPSFTLESCILKKDGILIWCQITSILFQDKGKTLGYTIIEDITEKHNLRIHREEFISVASHELKTPITSLKAVLQLINRMIKGDSSIPEKLAKLSLDAERYTGKLTTLISDLLNTTHIAQGRLTLNKTVFKLSEILETCCNHIRLDGTHHIKDEGDTSIEVNADQQKIEQVVINLVNNAVKYAPGSNEILIHIERFNKKVKISVTDYGKGILKKDIPHLFDRFYTGNKSGNHSSGLGLGLYISSEIIKAHGGEVGVSSKVEKGSTFWFTLPLA